MISEYFLNVSLSLLCSDLTCEKSKKKLIFEAISFIVSKYNSLYKKTASSEFSKKIDLIEYLSKYREDKNNFDFNEMIEELTIGKFSDEIEILKTIRKSEEKENEELIEKNVDFILNKKKTAHVVDTIPKFKEILDKYDSGNYKNDSELNTQWISGVENAYNQIKEIKKYESINQLTRINMRNDDYSSVMKDLRDTHKEEATISSGFRSLDHLLCGRGFEKRRFYLIAGTSSVGKSQMLSNFCFNAIKGKGDKTHDVYLYLTGENLISESLERLYCIMTGESYNSTVNRQMNDDSFNIGDNIKKILEHYNSDILLYYFKSFVTTLTDIRIKIEDAAQSGNLKAVYIDYLDLITSTLDFNGDIRTDQMKVAKGFKDLSIEFNIPVISATQLNRSGYDKESEPNLNSMGESMKKVDQADSVLFMQEAAENKLTRTFGGETRVYNKIKATMLKNRNARKNISTFVVTHELTNKKNVYNFRFEEMPGNINTAEENTKTEYLLNNSSNSISNKRIAAPLDMI